MGAIIPGQRILDNRPDALEEIIAQQRLRAVGVGFVRNHRPALAGRRIHIPGDVLLDGDGEPCLKGAVDPVRPLALIRVAIVGVQNRPIAIQELKGAEVTLVSESNGWAQVTDGNITGYMRSSVLGVDPQP